MAIGSLVVSVTSVCLFQFGIQLMPKVKQFMIHRSFQPKTCCLLIPLQISHPDTPPISAINPMVSLVIPMSWTLGPPHRCHRRSLANGKMMPICLGVCSPWTCVHKDTTSFVRGCSARSFVRTLNMIRFRGRTLHYLAGSLIPIAKKCRSQRATL